MVVLVLMRVPEKSKVLALYACVLALLACSSLPAPRASAARGRDTCAQDCPQFHVATTGDDRNPGTQEAPLRTIQKAMDAATAGTTVHAAAGTCADRMSIDVSGTPDANITFKPLGFSVPVEGCGGYTGVWKNNIVAGAAVSFVNTGNWAVGTVDHNLHCGGGVGPDAHKVTLSPQFMNPAAGDFRLGAGSPAIDAGDPATSTIEAGSLDLAGNPRIAKGRVDLGAFEY